MKEVIYIHGGLSKTGTTALQKFLSINRGALSALGYYVPAAGLMRNQHYFLAACLRPESESYLDYRHWEALIEEIRERPESRIILSSEGFSDVQNLKVVKQMTDLIAQRVVPIFYFRRQDEWLKALYKTRAKDVRRFNGPLSLYLTHFDARHRARCDYLSRTQNWAGVFKAGDVKARPYRHVSETSGIIHDFLDLIGLRRDQRSSLQDIELRTHVSAPDVATDLLARLNNLPSLPVLQWKISREVQDIAIGEAIGTGRTTRSCAYSDAEAAYVRQELSGNNGEFVSRFMKMHGQELLDSRTPDSLQLPVYDEEARILDQERIVERLQPSLRDHVRAVVRRAGLARAGEVPLPASELELLNNANRRLYLEMQWMRLSVNQERAATIRLERDRDSR